MIIDFIIINCLFIHLFVISWVVSALLAFYGWGYYWYKRFNKTAKREGCPSLAKPFRYFVDLSKKDNRDRAIGAAVMPFLVLVLLACEYMFDD